MSDIINLGYLIDPNQYEVYINEAEKLENFVHRYGYPYSHPLYPCWMEYKDEGNVLGSIAFTRNILHNPILKEMCEKICKVLTPIISDIETPQIERVSIIRTFGSLPVHKDEKGRMSCVNIGVKNSSKVITKISNDGILSNFKNNHTSHKIQEGYGYLLNTNQWHSVEGDYNLKRYLITYAFGTKFSKLKENIKIG